MIKTFTLISFLAIAIVSEAQIPKKAVILGGNISYAEIGRSGLPRDENQKWFNISAFTGIAIRPNTIIGINANVTPLNRVHYYTATDTAIMRGKGFSAGPFIRQYKSITRDLNLFIDLETSAGVQTSEMENSPGTGDWKSTAWNVGITAAPGISYRLFKQFHIQAKIPEILSIQYQRVNTDHDDPLITDQTIKAFDFSTRLSDLVSLGSVVIGFYFEL